MRQRAVEDVWRHLRVNQPTEWLCSTTYPSDDEQFHEGTELLVAPDLSNIKQLIWYLFFRDLLLLTLRGIYAMEKHAKSIIIREI